MAVSLNAGARRGAGSRAGEEQSGLRFFKLKDREKIVGAMSLDERAIGDIEARGRVRPSSVQAQRLERSLADIAVEDRVDVL